MSVSGIIEKNSNPKIKENLSDIAWTSSSGYFIPMDKIKDLPDDSPQSMEMLTTDQNETLAASESLLSLTESVTSPVTSPVTSSEQMCPPNTDELSLLHDDVQFSLSSPPIVDVIDATMIDRSNSDLIDMNCHDTLIPSNCLQIITVDGSSMIDSCQNDELMNVETLNSLNSNETNQEIVYDTSIPNDNNQSVVYEPITISLADGQQIQIDPTMAIQVATYMLQQQINASVVGNRTEQNDVDFETNNATYQQSVIHENIGITNLHTSLQDSTDPVLSVSPPISHHLVSSPHLLSHLQKPNIEEQSTSVTILQPQLNSQQEYTENLENQESVQSLLQNDIKSTGDNQNDIISRFDYTIKQQVGSIQKYTSLSTDINSDIVLCPKCAKPCPSKRALRDHERTHTEKVWKCHICMKAFKQKRNLHDHQSIHTGEKPYKCDKCFRSFRLQRDLKDHLSIHSNERNYACSMCDKKFRQKRDLRDHSSVHSGEKNFACGICSKTFRQKRDVRDHVKVHSKDRPYRCEICEKTFRNSRDLKDHHSVHTGEKPFSCSTCDKHFRQKRNLRDHERTHTAVKSFQCNICNRMFRLKRELLDHVKHLHRVEEITNYSNIYKSMLNPGPCDLLATVVSEANCSREETISILEY